MSVMYQGKKLIPAPFVSISKEYHLTDDGKQIGTLYNISVKGTLVAFKGSPDSDGAFWTQPGYPPDETLIDTQRLPSLLRKQQALRTMFSVEGKTFEIQGYDGSSPLKFNPRVKSIEFPDQQWFDKCEYVVNLESDQLEIIDGVEDDYDTIYISKASENWNIEPNEDLISYKMTHNVSAIGKRHYDETATLVKEAWKQAQDWVLTRLRFDTTIMAQAGVLDLTTIPYNRMRGVIVDEAGGGYTVNDTWLLYGGSFDALDDWTITRIANAEDGRNSFNIEGVITGLQKANTVTGIPFGASRYDNADSLFNSINFLSRVNTYFPTIVVHTSILSSSISRNVITGIIRYSVQYNDRPYTSISLAFSESITVTENNQGRVVAQVPVLGRTAGPVLQDIGTHTATTRTLVIEAVFPLPGQNQVAPTKPNTDSIVVANTPGGTQVYKEFDEDVFTPHTGRYTRNVRWVYES